MLRHRHRVGEQPRVALEQVGAGLLGGGLSPIRAAHRVKLTAEGGGFLLQPFKLRPPGGICGGGFCVPSPSRFRRVGEDSGAAEYDNILGELPRREAEPIRQGGDMFNFGIGEDMPTDDTLRQGSPRAEVIGEPLDTLPVDTGEP
jgi:hypothetical protein